MDIISLCLLACCISVLDGLLLTHCALQTMASAEDHKVAVDMERSYALIKARHEEAGRKGL